MTILFFSPVAIYLCSIPQLFCTFFFKFQVNSFILKTMSPKFGNTVHFFFYFCIIKILFSSRREKTRWRSRKKEEREPECWEERPG